MSTFFPCLHGNRRRLTAAACIGALLSTAACAPTTDRQPPAADGADKVFSLFEASDALTRKWRPVKIWSKSDWRLAVIDGDIAIEPVVDTSSSALVRWTEFDTADCPVAEWTWRVEALPKQTDLSSRESEDVAASLMFVFGDPGSMVNPDPVPTLRYIWAPEGTEGDSPIASPYYPDFLRSIVIRRGGAGERWVNERRNLREDYEVAFGEMPSEPVMVFALFTDNDHLGDPVKAYYRSAHVLCSELPDDDLLLQ